MAPKPQHHEEKAKSCIFLFMEGGVSQMDTYEYKPALWKHAGKQMPRAERTTGELATFSAAPNRVIAPFWDFKQYGQSGRWISSLLPNIANRVDDMAFIHGLKVDNNNHGPAVYHALTGNIIPGGASVGAWVTYGLGSENKDLPGFIVLGDRRGARRSAGRACGVRGICRLPIRARFSAMDRHRLWISTAGPVLRKILSGRNWIF